ncbi:MAG: heme exporter protein CcmD [Rhodospirillaceae bacterium]
MADYFAMGGYAAYVWPAYAITVAMLVGMLIATLYELRSYRDTLNILEAQRPSRATRRSAAPSGTEDEP